MKVLIGLIWIVVASLIAGAAGAQEEIGDKKAGLASQQLPGEIPNTQKLELPMTPPA